MVRDALAERYGTEELDAHFRNFDTICSATQERQDAVLRLLAEPLDVMVVVGGYNSSNTCNLAALVHSRDVPVFHIEDAAGVDPASGTIRHRDVRTRREVETARWLGASRIIGITAGASTPNNKVGETIARICASAGLADELQAVLTATASAPPPPA